jgi:hypothetical protein
MGAMGDGGCWTIVRDADCIADAMFECDVRCLIIISSTIVPLIRTYIAYRVLVRTHCMYVAYVHTG